MNADYAAIMISNLISVIGVIGVLCTILVPGTSRKQLYKYAAFTYGVQVPINLMLGQMTAASLILAATAYWTYQWWRHGGDDDTKRRLKKWGRAFTPVRRTAPQAA